MLQMMLDMHPEMAIAHEAHFVAVMARRRRRYGSGAAFDIRRFVEDLYANPNFSRLALPQSDVLTALTSARPVDLAEAVRIVFSVFADSREKPRYGDKTPGYVNRIKLLARLFPEARFVHLIRDGRDVASGYLDQEWGPGSIREAGHYWRTRVGRGRRAGLSLGPTRYLEMRYEDLVSAPEAELLRLCAFLEVEFVPAMLEYHRDADRLRATTAHPDAHARLAQPPTPGVRDWRKDLSPEAVAEFEAVAGGLLGALGYDLATATPSPLSLTRGWSWIKWQARRAASRLPTG